MEPPIARFGRRDHGVVGGMSVLAGVLVNLSDATSKVCRA